VNLRRSRAWKRQPGSARRRWQAAVGRTAACDRRQRNRPRFQVDAGHLGAQLQLDAVIRVEVRGRSGTQSSGALPPDNPSTDWAGLPGRLVVADHHDAALVALAPQHLGCCKAGCSAADDNDSSWCWPARFARCPVIR